jgi:hypothetical protein
MSWRERIGCVEACKSDCQEEMERGRKSSLKRTRELRARSIRMGGEGRLESWARK